MKLSKVEIQAFRVYDEVTSGTFDFCTETGETADFISIYAPNGFGKTSFYDAVEWLFTGKVKRIYEQVAHVKRDKKLGINPDDGRKILRNKNSKPGTPTFVRVYRDDGTKLERTLARPRKDSTDLVHPAGKIYSRDFRKALLEQEGIDAFLRSDDPRDRYQEWAKYFGHENAESYNQTIGNLIALNRDEIDKLNGQRHILNAQGFEGDRKKLVLINDLLVRIHEGGTELPVIDESFDEGSWVDFIQRLGSEIVTSNQAIGREKARIADIEAVIAGSGDLIDISSYRQIEKKRTNILGEIALLEIKRGRLDELSILTRALNILSVETNEQAFALKRIRKLSDDYSTFASQASKIAANEQKIMADKRRIDELDDLKLQSEENVAGLESRIEDLNKSLTVQKNQLSDYPEVVADLTRLQVERAAQIEYKETVEKQLRTAFENRKRAPRVQLAAVERSIASIRQGKLNFKIEVVDPDLKVTLTDLRKKIEKEASIRESIASIEDRLEAHNALQSDLEKLLSLGLQIVGSSEQSDCPLCHQPYESSKALLAKISANELLVTEVKTLSGQRKHFNSEAQRTKTEIEGLRNDLLERLGSLHEQFVDEMEQLDAMLAELKDNLSENDALLSETDQQIVAISTRFLGLSPDAYRKRVESDIKKTQEKITAATREFEKLTGETGDLDAKLAMAFKRIESLESMIQIAKGDRSYIAFMEEVESFGLTAPSTKAQLTRRVATAQKDLDAKVVGLRSKEKEIKEKRSQIGGLTEETISSELERCQQLLESLQAEQTFFEIFVEGRLDIDPVAAPPTKKGLVKMLETARASLLELNKTGTLLLRIESMKDAVAPFLKFWSNNKQLSELDGKIQDKTRINELLEEEKKYVGTSISESIKDFFHEDLINGIYQAIDPHPLYKTVRFDCRFNERQPTLDVIVDDGVKDSIVPNLYYSAAQINVLSLSIFLARALKARDDNDNHFDYILVDDPIQSMDSINILSTIDLLRGIVVNLRRQIILATHDENFHNLLKRKMPSGSFKSKFIELETYGKVKN